MFKLANEIASAKHQESKRKKGALAQEHGIHAFVFLSFIFAEAVKLIVERWISIRALHPEDCGSAAVIFLIAITILSVQYWWVIYESAFFYGANLFNFSCGAIEAALFYAVCYLLREFDGLSEPFFVFGAMVISFILVDLVKHIEDENHQWKIGNLAPRQLFRLVAIIAAFLGGFADQGSIQVKYLNPLVVSSTLLALVVVYTVLTSYAHWVAVSDSKRSQAVEQLDTTSTRAGPIRRRSSCLALRSEVASFSSREARLAVHETHQSVDKDCAGRWINTFC